MNKGIKKTIKIQYRNRVSRSNYGRYTAVPWINLSGLWLEQQGFSIGSVLDVELEENRIILTKKA